MSMGANLSSGYTSKVNQKAQGPACHPLVRQGASACCIDSSGQSRSQIYPSAVYPSMLGVLQAQSCPAPTPEQLALYPKVAVPSSVLTESRKDRTYAWAIALESTHKFSQDTAYEPQHPC